MDGACGVMPLWADSPHFRSGWVALPKKHVVLPRGSSSESETGVVDIASCFELSPPVVAEVRQKQRPHVSEAGEGAYGCGHGELVLVLA